MCICVYVHIFIINSNVLKCSFSWLFLYEYVSVTDVFNVFCAILCCACALTKVGSRLGSSSSSASGPVTCVRLVPTRCAPICGICTSCHNCRVTVTSDVDGSSKLANMFKHVQTTRNQFATLIAVKAQIKGRLGHKPQKEFKEAKPG